MHGPQFFIDHRFTRSRLSAYLDGDLPPADRRRVERHVGECRNCEHAERSLRRMLAGLALLRRCRRSRVVTGVLDRLRMYAGPRGAAGGR